MIRVQQSLLDEVLIGTHRHRLRIDGSEHIPSFQSCLGGRTVFVDKGDDRVDDRMVGISPEQGEIQTECACVSVDLSNEGFVILDECGPAVHLAELRVRVTKAFDFFCRVVGDLPGGQAVLHFGFPEIVLFYD